MDVAYKGPDGRLYRVSERPDAEGLYYIEYRDPAASAVYKPLPGYDRSTNRAEVVEWLGMAAQRQKWTVVDGDPAAKPAAPEKPKGTGSAAKAASDPETIPEWAIPIAQEFVSKKWVRELAEFSAAALRASKEAFAHAGGTCGPGFADTSPKGIKLWEGAPGHGIEYTWTKFVRACKAAGIGPAVCADAVTSSTSTESVTRPADICTTCLCNTCGNDDCDNAPGCQEDKDFCARTHSPTAKCDEYRPKSAISQVSTEPPETVDGCSEQDIPAATEPAAMAVPPAADIAAPGFDYTQVDADTANLLRELESSIVENQKTAVQVASTIGEKLQRGHDYLAKKGYGCYGEWCESLGYNRTQAKRLTDLHNFVCNTMLQTERDAIEALPLTVAYQVANPNTPEEVKEAARNGDISTLKELEDLRAQLKATEQAKEAAEREAREALAWKQHAEGQAEDAKAAIHEAQQSAQEARRETEDLKQKLYRRNEELAEREQMLNVTMDQQGMYIAKMQEQEDMLADLQDRLDDTTAQLRSRPVPAEVVDQDEVERRARELAAEKIAEALGAQERQPLCDLAMALNNAIRSAWDLSGLDDREPESEDDDTALEVLYETLCQIAAWAEGRLELKDEEVTGDE